MSGLRRRAILAGGCGALFAAGVGVAQTADAGAFRVLLDRVAAESDPSRRLGMFLTFDAGAVPPDMRPVHATVLHGLRTEAALRQLFPFGRGASLYAVHPRSTFTRATTSAAEGRAALVRDLDAETEGLRADAARGPVLPRYLLDRTLERMKAERASAPAELWGALDRQAAALEAVRPLAPGEAGVWRLKDGDAWYALALGFAAGAAVAPDAAHAQALDAARTLRARADRLLRGQGLTRGGVGARLRALMRDPRWLYADDAAGKARAVADMNASLESIVRRLPTAFGTTPLPSGEVRRLSDAEEAAGRQGYRADPAGGGPGLYYVDLSRIRRRPAWTLASVVHHELHPGHLLQATRAPRPHPLQARYAGGYGEGWAIYAEQLADELGAFEGDPRGELGYLQWMLFRLGRLAADTGIHARRWTRERAVAALREMQGDDIAFVSIEEDVDRIIAGPGGAGGQMLVAMELLRLRDAARTSMGGRFALPPFHDAVLRHGPLGVEGLRTSVGLWSTP